jgi:hypothetical protein
VRLGRVGKGEDAVDADADPAIVDQPGLLGDLCAVRPYVGADERDAARGRLVAVVVTAASSRW